MADLIDNRRQRIQTLKEIITGLHQGVPTDQVRQQLAELVGQTDASEIAAMEQQLIDEGMPTECIMAMCDLHSQVVGDILVERPSDPVIPGHPVDTFRRENQALRQAVTDFRAALQALLAGEDTEPPSATSLDALRQRHNDLMDVEKHYARKENLLFPFLEKHAITGPSRVMWGKDDEARDLLKSAGQALDTVQATVTEWKLVADAVFQPALEAVEEMIRKEEDILLPMALDALTAAEWGEIWEQSPEIGYCLADPGDEYRLPAPVQPPELLGIEGAVSSQTSKNGAALVTPTGSLTVEQLKGIFAALPVDVTFIDADDRVRYFSEGPQRIFDRSRAIIGRKVQHCHPPSSVDVVEKILADFRAGREDACSFWIDFKGRFVYIRYFAVRDADGDYQGTLEVTQQQVDLERSAAMAESAAVGESADPSVKAVPIHVKRGEVAFNRNCAMCHQIGGVGKLGIAPSLRNPDFLALASDDFIRQTIREGREQTAMIPRPELPREDVENIIAYLRSVQDDEARLVTLDPNLQATGDTTRAGRIPSCSGGWPTTKPRKISPPWWSTRGARVRCRGWRTSTPGTATTTPPSTAISPSTTPWPTPS